MTFLVATWDRLGAGLFGGRRRGEVVSVSGELREVSSCTVATMATRGRPPKPLDPDASHGARLGAELRTHRLEEGLTLQALGDLTGYTPQHVSEVERAKTAPTRPFIAACDRALDAQGALLALLPAVVHERDAQRRERAARRAARDLVPLRCGAPNAGDEDVDPTNRRGLLGAGAGAAVALGLGATAVPTQARQIDPELPAHLARMLNVLGRHDMVCGPQDVLSAVRYELGLIIDHRQVARGRLRVDLMRIESRWSDLAAWLSEDTGQSRMRDAYTDHALWLAREADDPDLVAFARARRSEWAAMARNASAAALAEAALGVPGASAQTRAWGARQAALGYALAGDKAACERRLSDAYGFLEHTDSPVPPWAHEFRVTHSGALATEACCWLYLDPRKAISLYDRALRDWPRDEARDAGLHRARLALACAAAGEHDRAMDEGRTAYASARATGSNSAARELKRLAAELRE